MITKQLLDRYFKQQCSAEERITVEAYLQGTDHTLLDEFLHGKWGEAAAGPTIQVVPPAIELPSRTKVRYMGLKWAAVFTGMLMLSAAAYFLFLTTGKKTPVNPIARQQWKELNNHGNDIRSVVMGDGTRIWLNKNAVLRYPDNYNEASRDVELIGEAYFEVAQNSSLPFRVHTAHVTTTALGTAFNISAFTRQDTAICISLLEGKVAVASADSNDTQVLTPGMAVNFEGSNMQEAITDSAVFNATGWMKDKIYFNNATLKEVCRRLSWQYDEKVIAKGNAGQQRISGMFNTSDDFKTIIAAITYVHKLQVKYTPEGCTITKN